MRIIRRGQIYYVNLDPVIGSEQGGIRPCVVVSNNVGNKFSPTVTIVPITSAQRKHPLPTHVDIPRSCGLETDSLLLAEQIMTVDRSRFGEHIGRLDDVHMSAVDDALAIGIGIKKTPCAKT